MTPRVNFIEEKNEFVKTKKWRSSLIGPFRSQRQRTLFIVGLLDWKILSSKWSIKISDSIQESGHPETRRVCLGKFQNIILNFACTEPFKLEYIFLSVREIIRAVIHNVEYCDIGILRLAFPDLQIGRSWQIFVARFFHRVPSNEGLAVFKFNVLSFKIDTDYKYKSIKNRFRIFAIVMTRCSNLESKPP